MSQIHTMDASELLSRLSHPEPGPPDLLIDVRDASEFLAVHLAGTHLVPLPLVVAHAAEIADLIGEQSVLLICQSGQRAEQARQRLAAVGVQRLRVVSGGMAAILAAGGQAEVGRARWLMERQVRLAAGLLVLIGSVTSLWIPQALGLAIAIGAGLTFSAVTNTCTMARVLGWLPYNRIAVAPTLPELRQRLAG